MTSTEVGQMSSWVTDLLVKFFFFFFLNDSLISTYFDVFSWVGHNDPWVESHMMRHQHYLGFKVI